MKCLIKSVSEIKIQCNSCPEENQQYFFHSVCAMLRYRFSEEEDNPLHLFLVWRKGLIQPCSVNLRWYLCIGEVIQHRFSHSLSKINYTNV